MAEQETEVQWIETGRELPPAGEVVETKLDDEIDGPRNQQYLRRRGSLWFTDSGIYVHSLPTHWRRNDRRRADRRRGGDRRQVKGDG